MVVTLLPSCILSKKEEVPKGTVSIDFVSFKEFYWKSHSKPCAYMSFIGWNCITWLFVREARKCRVLPFVLDWSHRYSQQNWGSVVRMNAHWGPTMSLLQVVILEQDTYFIFLVRQNSVLDEVFNILENKWPFFLLFIQNVKKKHSWHFRTCPLFGYCAPSLMK